MRMKVFFSVVSTYVDSHENSTNKGNFQQPYKLAKKGSSEIQNCTVRFSTCSGRIKQLGLNFLEQFCKLYERLDIRRIF